MAKRYIPNTPISTSKGSTYNAVYTPDRVGLDGSVGYSYEEVKHLGKAMLEDAFRVIDFAGEGVVEAATAAPGEKRAVSKPKSKAKTT